MGENFTVVDKAADVIRERVTLGPRFLGLNPIDEWDARGQDGAGTPSLQCRRFAVIRTFAGPQVRRQGWFQR